MELTDNTVNQHFISQAELKNNRIIRDNGFETDLIYQFKILDRDNNNIQITNIKGMKIIKTLSFNDIFTFNYNNEQRESLEKLFWKYEQKISNITEHIKYLIFNEKAELSNTSGLLYDLLCLKFLNFVRNPNNITKAVNTFGAVLKYYINNPQFVSYYRKIEFLSEEKCLRICKTFNVTDKEYRRWIKMLLLLLYPTSNQSNILEEFVKSIFYETDMATGIVISHISDNENTFLLSDRGCLFGPDEEKGFVLHFNLTSEIFISYGFLRPNFTGISKDLLNKFHKMSKKINVNIMTNNYDDIKYKNMLTIYQGNEYVYSAKKHILL